MKRKMLTLLFLGILISSFTIVFFVGIYTEMTINKFVKAYEEQTLSWLEEKIKIFHKTLLLIEKNMAKIGQKAILNIYEEIQNKDPHKLSQEELKKLALENHVDEIYLINKQGRLFATSFRPDLNFNLFSLSPEFKDFLKEIYGQGKVITERIEPSNKIGKLNMYFYYGPKGKDYLLEVSMDVKNYMIEHYSSDYYNYFFSSFFKNNSQEKGYLKYVNIYHVSDLKAISMTSGRISDKENLFFERLRKGEVVKVKNGNFIRVYKRIAIGEEGFGWVTGKYVEACFDFSPIKGYRKKIVIFSVLISGLLVGIFFWIFSTLMHKQFIEKLLKINRAITLIAGGNYDHRIEIKGDDEMSQIAWNINKMAEAIKESNERLKEYSKSLEQKVKERTWDLELKNKILEAIREKLELLSRTDPLTGLLNRRAMWERLEQERIRFERNKKPFALIIGDIDDFKRFNDEFGHQCGDFILKSTASIIKSLIRKQDILARWGGEEFLLLLPETDEEGAYILAEKVRKKLSEINFKYNGVDHAVTMTFGISVYNSMNKKINDCLREADQALYAGKRSGKNCVVKYSSLNFKVAEKRH